MLIYVDHDSFICMIIFIQIQGIIYTNSRFILLQNTLKETLDNDAMICVTLTLKYSIAQALESSS